MNMKTNFKKIQSKEYDSQKLSSPEKSKKKLLSQKEIEILLDELESNDWLSDKRFVEQFIHTKKSKYGSRKISHELSARGIDEDLIAKNLMPLKDEEYFFVKNIWVKKFNTIPKTNDEKLKQIRFLQSRGFDLSLIHQIISGKDKN